MFLDSFALVCAKHEVDDSVSMACMGEGKTRNSHSDCEQFGSE